MKRSILRFTLPFTVLLAVPFIYNACQSHLLGGAIGTTSTSCKLTMENGAVHALKVDAKAVPAAFLTSKVQLKSPISTSGTSARAKNTAAISVRAGTKLGVLIDNSCLQENVAELESTVISKAALLAGGMLPQLDRQIYLWELERTYSDDEIETLANQESCVVGVSWNHEYKIQGFNDPSYSVQGHLPAIHAEQAYNYFYASPGGMNMSTGTSVVLAAVDTGVDWTHPDLQGHIWQHTQGMGIDITTLGTSNVSYDPQDVSPIGHGTHVSGIMGAISNNGLGVVGTMPYRAQVMGVKIFQSDGAGGVTTSSQFFYNGIKFAYLNGANVINLSLGSVTSGAASDSLALTGLNEAVEHGVVVVVVIGNADSGNGQVVDGSTLSSIPGQYANINGVIGVGSFDSSTGNKSYFSHYSTTYAEIGAPGAESDSTGILSTLPVADSSYGRLMGTSQAAPMVSAAAGLTIGLIREAYGILPSPAEVERLILTSAIKSPQLTSYFKNGNRLDLLNLVAQINHDYPLTATGGHASLSGSCP